MKDTISLAGRKYLTPEQFLRLPLSEAILQVIEDVKRMHGQGVRIDMDSWFTTDGGCDHPRICSVCLGGAAICSFAPEKINGYSIGQFSNKVLGLRHDEESRILQTFNNLRAGELRVAFHLWYGACPHFSTTEWTWTRHYYSGKIFGKNLKGMIESLKLASRILAKNGY